MQLDCFLFAQIKNAYIYLSISLFSGMINLFVYIQKKKNTLCNNYNLIVFVPLFSSIVTATSTPSKMIIEKELNWWGGNVVWCVNANTNNNNKKKKTCNMFHELTCNSKLLYPPLLNMSYANICFKTRLTESLMWCEGRKSFRQQLTICVLIFINIIFYFVINGILSIDLFCSVVTFGYSSSSSGW
jgi:hypothetical protein